jgi:hypothetical protein
MKTWMIIALLVLIWLMFRQPLKAVQRSAYQVGNAATGIGVSVAGATSLAGLGAFIGGIIHGPSNPQPPMVAGSATSTAGVGPVPADDNDDMSDLTMH